MKNSRKKVPFEFVLDEFSGMDLRVKPMFGAYGVYIGNKIIFVLRKKEKMDFDTGIWVGIPDDCILEMKEKFPVLQNLTLFGKPPTAWQVLRETELEFEEIAFALCKLIKKGDPRIGRIPKLRLKKRKPSQ